MEEGKSKSRIEVYKDNQEKKKEASRPPFHVTFKRS